MDELTVRRYLKQSVAEFKEIHKAYKEEPNKQLRFDLSLKYLEVKVWQRKLKNLKKGTD